MFVFYQVFVYFLCNILMTKFSILLFEVQNELGTYFSVKSKDGRIIPSLFY